MCVCVCVCVCALVYLAGFTAKTALAILQMTITLFLKTAIGKSVLS